MHYFPALPTYKNFAGSDETQTGFCYYSGQLVTFKQDMNPIISLNAALATSGHWHFVSEPGKSIVKMTYIWISGPNCSHLVDDYLYTVTVSQGLKHI